VIDMKKEGKKMAVLAKPINMAFELSPDKTEQFLTEIKNSDALQKALERANKHKVKETSDNDK